MFESRITTVWSAPNYCYRCGNLAAVVQLDENLKRRYKVIKAVPKNEKDETKKNIPDYFL